MKKRKKLQYFEQTDSSQMILLLGGNNVIPVGEADFTLQWESQQVNEL